MYVSEGDVEAPFRNAPPSGRFRSMTFCSRRMPTASSQRARYRHRAPAGREALAFITPKCRDTEALHARVRVRRFVAIESVARRKLRQLELAARLDDLRVPPGNRLEALVGDRTGQHSIRVSDQWRICFRWTEGGAEDVEIVDYH